MEIYRVKRFDDRAARHQEHRHRRRRQQLRDQLLTERLPAAGFRLQQHHRRRQGHRQAAMAVLRAGQRHADRRDSRRDVRAPRCVGDALRARCERRKVSLARISAFDRDHGGGKQLSRRCGRDFGRLSERRARVRRLDGQGALANALLRSGRVFRRLSAGERRPQYLCDVLGASRRQQI